MGGDVDVWGEGGGHCEWILDELKAMKGLILVYEMESDELRCSTF